jgi:hypothetical protein
MCNYMQYRPIFAINPLVGVPFYESGDDISGLFLHLRLPFHNFDYFIRCREFVDLAGSSTSPQTKGSLPTSQTCPRLSTY